jgi:hypothetical protein
MVEAEMKRFGLSTFLVMISVGVFSSCTAGIYSNNQTNTRGNTVGNILNYGFVAQEGDWFFFNTSKNEEGSLWKKNIKTKKESVKISDEPGLFLNVVDGWIYYSVLDIYSGKEETGIFKIRTDGSERIMLNSDLAGFINVVDGWIYYTLLDLDIYSEEVETGIFKIRTDGSQRTQLSKDQATDINVYDGWIYFSNPDGEGIYKINVDGTQRTLICEDDAGPINVVDGWIYYVNQSDEFSFYKIRSDVTKRTKIYSYNSDSRENLRGSYFVNFMNVHGDWIYFLDYSENKDYVESGKIFKVRTDGSKLTKISDNRYDLINVIDGSIYASDEDKIFKIPSNGSKDPQLVE